MEEPDVVPQGSSTALPSAPHDGDGCADAEGQLSVGIVGCWLGVAFVGAGFEWVTQGARESGANSKVIGEPLCLVPDYPIHGCFVGGFPQKVL